MRKVVGIFLTFVIILTVICGCGENDTSSDSSDKSSNVSSQIDSNESSSSEIVSSENSDDVQDTIISPIDTPSEEVASSGKTSTSSDLSAADKDEEEGEEPLRNRIQGGINFEDLQGGSKAYTSYVYDRQYYELVAEAGFDHIRLPVKFDAYVVGDAPDYLLDTEAMRWLDVCVDNAIDTGLVIILDFHKSNYKTNPECFKMIWKQVAERYRDYPEELMFEIVNEPDGTSHDSFNELQLATVKLIRETNPTRTIAYSVNWVNHWKALWSTAILPGDENVMLSIHNYDTMAFTHGGMSDKYGDKVALTQNILDVVTRDLEYCADYQEKTGHRVWISEWGAYQGGVSEETLLTEMPKYYKHFTSECARLDLAYAVWEFNHGFGIYDWDNKQWNSYLLDNMVLHW